MHFVDTYLQIRKVLQRPTVLRIVLDRGGRGMYTAFYSSLSILVSLRAMLRTNERMKARQNSFPSPRAAPVTRQTCYSVKYVHWQRITQLTFPFSEKVGNTLDFVCASVFDHRTQEVERRPCNRGTRKAKAGARHRGFMASTYTKSGWQFGVFRRSTSA
jgi:hypothetical protein